MNRPAIAALLTLSLLGGLAPALAQKGELQVQIESIPAELLLTNRETSIDVEGWASVFGGLKHMDLFLVLDTSESLKFTDPNKFRTPAAVELVRNLPVKSDIHVGLVTFDTRAHQVVPLTADRQKIIDALGGLPVAGGTDLAEGIRAALVGFADGAREDSARIMLLFTDGKSDAAEALAAAQAAHDKRTVIHTLLLGNTEKGEDLLRKVAETTGGSFVFVQNPEDLPQAFANLRTTGVDSVTLSANGAAALKTEFVSGTFHGRVPLVAGRNTISATATDLEGKTRSHAVQVTVTGPLRVAIREPPDGYLFRERQSDTPVAVSASIFDQTPAELFRDFPAGGIESVTLSANGSPPVPARYAEGQFSGRVPLTLLGNHIVAVAKSFDGRTAQAAIDVTVRPPGCSELRVRAERDGSPAISLADRGVEFIFDASNSMWGQIQGKPKIEIAKETLQAALDGLPADLHVALRVYGHQHATKKNDCEDSQLLAPLGLGNREAIREAILGFKPRGQTPLAYSIAQATTDFGEFQGDRAVVLLTDGVESCNGDPVAAGRGLQVEGKHRPVHVIGFGLEKGQEQAQAGLEEIATSSGGRYFAAGNSDELRQALGATAGTPYTLWSGTNSIGRGTLGADDVFQLGAGDYTVRLESDPPREFPFHVDAEQSVGLVLTRQADEFSTKDARQPLAYVECPAERR